MTCLSVACTSNHAFYAIGHPAGSGEPVARRGRDLVGMVCFFRNATVLVGERDRGYTEYTAHRVCVGHG